MTILDQLQDHQHWLAFYEYKKVGGHMSADDEQALWTFIEGEQYLPVVDGICTEFVFLPSKDRRKEGGAGSDLPPSYRRDVLL